MTDTAQQRYLRIVQSALADVPHDRRTMVLEDVQAHIQDAVDHGASVEDALTQLGPAKALAYRAREEMSSVLPSLAAGVRASRILIVGAVVIGTVTTLLTAFAAPFWSTVDRFDDGTNVLRTTADPGGPWVALVGLAPVVVAAITLFLPRRPARILLLVLAILITVAALGGFTVAGWFLPFIAQLWVAVFLPIAVSRGFDLSGRPKWRLAAAASVIVVTGVATIRSLTAPDGVGILAAVVLSIGLVVATLVGLGVRACFLILAGGGLALMFVSTVAAPFMLPVWWLGGALFVSGSAGVAAQQHGRSVRGES